MESNGPTTFSDSKLVVKIQKFTPSPLGVIRIKSPDGKVKLFQANRKDRRAFLRRNRKRLIKA